MAGKRPTKGAHGKDLVRYAKALGWTESSSRGGHVIFTKGTHKVAISRATTQPVGVGTIVKIVKELESA